MLTLPDTKSALARFGLARCVSSLESRSVGAAGGAAGWSPDGCAERSNIIEEHEKLSKKLAKIICW